jgi:transposase-like protein
VVLAQPSALRRCVLDNQNETRQLGTLFIEREVSVAGGWWVKYSPEFRAQALERLKGCVNVSALARELGISRKWLYLWRDRKPVPSDPRSKGERERDRLRKRVAELERLTGQQAAQIDFFKGALRRVEERRPRNDASGGAASTSKSK